jgi:hypothetical protein
VIEPPDAENDCGCWSAAAAVVLGTVGALGAVVGDVVGADDVVGAEEVVGDGDVLGGDVVVGEDDGAFGGRTGNVVPGSVSGGINGCAGAEVLVGCVVVASPATVVVDVTTVLDGSVVSATGIVLG